MTDMPLADALALADHASPMPHLAGLALRRLRREIAELSAAQPADSGRVDVAAIQSVIAELRNIDDIRKPSPTLGWVGRAADKLQHALTAALAAPDDAAALLDALQHNSWDLRCFDHTDGEDIGWRVIEHYQAEPRERVIAEVFEDNPRYAIKQALLAAAPSAPEGDGGGE